MSSQKSNSNFLDKGSDEISVRSLVDESVTKAVSIGHSKFSASGSKTWLMCPGSINLSKLAPPEPESPYAIEGTAAHALAEVSLRMGASPIKCALSLLPPEFHSHISVEMRAHVFSYYRLVTEKVKETGGTLLVETKFDLSHIAPDLGGTTDAAIIEEFGDIYVYDLKYGKGVAVSAKDNTQQIIYALGVANQINWDFTNAHLTIVQPRVLDGVQTWTVTRDELKSWEKTLADGVTMALKNNAPLVPGKEQCRFCKAKPVCPAIKSEAQHYVTTYGDKIATLSPENLAEILDKRGLIESFLESVQSAALHYAQGGGIVPGYKLADKRATRKWAKPIEAAAEAKKLFKNKAFTKPELLSPAQMDKLKGGKEFSQQYAIGISSGVTLVKSEDSRPDKPAQVQLDFDDSGDA